MVAWAERAPVRSIPTHDRSVGPALMSWRIYDGKWATLDKRSIRTLSRRPPFFIVSLLLCGSPEMARSSQSGMSAPCPLLGGEAD